MNDSTKRNQTIDLVKGIAIILVLITHYEWTAEQRKNPIFPFIINMAVPIFMIITGYVYSLSMHRKGISSLNCAYRWPSILKRFVRYTIPLLFVIGWELVDPHYTLSKAPLDLLRWCIDGTTGKGNYYYPIMLQMIFVFPVIYFIIDRNKEKGLWICFAINAIYEILAWAYYLNLDTYRLLVFRYLFLIAVGVYAYKGYKIKLLVGIVMTAVGMAFIALVIYGGYKPTILNATWASTNFISGMLIAPLMIWVLQKKVKVHFKVLSIIGRASYHIFLVQMMYYLGYYADMYSLAQGKDTIHLILGILICLVVGIAFYYIEKPIQDWLQRKIRMMEQKKGKL